MGVAFGDAVDEGLDQLADAAVLDVAEKVAARDRRDGHADEVRGHHRDGDREGERGEELLREPRQQEDGQAARPSS